MFFCANPARPNIKEPFFKLRTDGTLGIRVDDPSDIVLDVELPSDPHPQTARSVEQRIAELLREDGNLGQKHIREILQEEGHCVRQKRLRQLLGQIRSVGESNRPSFVGYCSDGVGRYGRHGDGPDDSRQAPRDER